MEMKVTKYLSESGRELTVYNPLNLDYPIAIQIAGKKCSFVCEQEVTHKVSSGDMYFDRMKHKDRLEIGRLKSVEQINQAFDRGEAPRPKNKREEMSINRYLVKSAASIAEKLRDTVVVYIL